MAESWPIKSLEINAALCTNRWLWVMAGTKIETKYSSFYSFCGMAQPGCMKPIILVTFFSCDIGLLKIWFKDNHVDLVNITLVMQKIMTSK